MHDLVRKYFSEDLTEAEQEALSRLLLESDEAALEFETAAKEAYFRYGFPEPRPQWGGEKPPSMGTGPSGWVWGLSCLVLLAGLGGMIWKFHWLGPLVPGKTLEQGLTQAGSVSKGKGPGILRPRQAVVQEPVRMEGRKDEGESPDLSEGSPSAPKLTGPAAGRVPQEIAEAQARRVSPPVNLDLHPVETYSNLAVIVDLAQGGDLLVLVTGTSGSELERLYQGRLAPGNWKFEWDGKLPDGNPAPAGFYKIEVRCGSFRQFKSIQIQ